RLGPRAAVGPFALGGLDAGAAVAQLDLQLDRWLGDGVDFVATATAAGDEAEGLREEVHRVLLSDLGIAFDAGASVAGALARRRGALGWLRSVFAPHAPGKLTWTAEPQALEAAIRELATRLYVPAQNARLDAASGRVTPGSAGRVLDESGAVRMVLAWAEQVSAGAVTPDEGRPRLALPVLRVAPRVSAADLAGLMATYPGFGLHLLSGYTTRFDPEQEGRTN